MKLALAQRRIKSSYATVKRAMIKGNLFYDSRRSPDELTKAEKNAEHPENIIKQNFTADAPDRKWLTEFHAVQSMGDAAKCYDNARTYIRYLVKYRSIPGYLYSAYVPVSGTCKFVSIESARL